MPQYVNDKQITIQKDALNKVLAKIRHVRDVDNINDKYALLANLPDMIDHINTNLLDDPQETVEDCFASLVNTIVINHKDESKNKVVEDLIISIVAKMVDVYANRTRDVDTLAFIVKIFNKKSILFYKAQAKPSIWSFSNSKDEREPTKFLLECVAIVLTELSKYQKLVWQLSLKEITDLINFVNMVQPTPLHTKEGIQFIENLCSQLLALFKSGRPELINFSSMSSLRLLEQHLLKKTEKQQLIKSIFELGLSLAETLLHGTSQQRKTGLNIYQHCIDRYSFDRIYKYKQSQFKVWMNSHEIYEYVFSLQQFCSQAIDKYKDFFKYIKRCKTYDDKTSMFVKLLKSNVDQRISKYIYSEIDCYYLNFKSKEMIFDYFNTFTQWTNVPLQYFEILQELPVRAENDTFVEKVFGLALRIVKQSYEKWNDSYRIKGINALKTIFTKFNDKYKGWTLEAKQKLLKESMFELLSNIDSVNILIFNLTIIEGEMWKILSNNPYQNMLTEVVEKSNFFEKIFKYLETKMEKKTNERQFLKLIKFVTTKILSKQDATFKYIHIICKFPEVFEELLENTGYAQMEEQMKKVLILFKEDPETPFHILTLTFQKLNYSNFSDYYKQPSLILQKKEQKSLVKSPKLMKYYDQIFGLMVETNSSTLRSKLCEYILSLYLNHRYAKSYAHYESGQECFITFTGTLLETLVQDYKSFIENPSESNQIQVDLQLIDKALEFTDFLGCGIYKPHKSLVSTSTILLTVINNVTFGDDVVKMVHRDFPSSMILFDVLTTIGLSFKCGPESIVLKQNGKFIPPIFNCRSLEDLNLTSEEIIAEQNQANYMQTPQLLQSKTSRELKPEIIKVITEVFNRFAFEGKMSILQCTNYVRQASGSQCISSDRRVKEIFQFDTDNDNIITLPNFIEYYRKNLGDSYTYYKEQALKGIFNLRYRKNLTLYSEPLDISPLYYTMTRYRIVKNFIFIYEILFNLAANSHQKLSDKAKQMLLYLPSYYQLKKQIEKEINFSTSSEFEVYYKLIFIQSDLNSPDGTHGLAQSKKNKIQQFVNNKNNEIIFMLLSKYHTKANKSVYEEKSLLICLRILRSLINIEYLPKIKISDYKFDQIFIPHLPETTFFSEQTILAYNSRNIINFQTLLVLQLTQQNVDIDSIIKSCFQPEEEIRKISCNFIYFWLVKTKFSFSLFDLPIAQENNEEWFELLCGIIRQNNSINIESLREASIIMLQSRYESFHNHYDYLMNGYLKILSAITAKDRTMTPGMKNVLDHLLQHSLSVKNRALIFELIQNLSRQVGYAYFDKMLTNTLPSQECKIREKYMGLKNLGATCYINSILQQFFMIDKFKYLVLNRNIPKDCKEVEVNGKIIVDNFMYQLQKLYHHLMYSQKKYYVPKEFCYSFKNFQGEPINTSLQEDAHEFLNRLIENAEETFKKQESLHKLQELFTIKKLTEIQCEKCSNKIDRLQTDNCLTIQVKNMNNLFDTLRKYTQKEEITDYFCEKCEQKVDKISKRTFLNQLPEIVILNLQRIIYDQIKGEKVKVHTELSFPQILNFQQFIKNDDPTLHTEYNLKGIAIHSGTSQGGHYYSLIKTKKYGWLKFNDQNVTLFDEKDIERQSYGGFQAKDGWGEVTYSTNAYILFYQKSNLPPQEFIEVQNEFAQEIQKDNVKLINELQTHQQSFFNAIISHYYSIRLPNLDELVKTQPYLEQKLDPNLKSQFQKLFKIIQKAFTFLTVYSEIKQQVRTKIGHIFIQLIFLLPEQTLSYLKQCNIRTYIENVISNSTMNERETLRQVFCSIILVHCRYYGISLAVKSQDYAYIYEIFNIVISYIQTNLFYSSILKISSYLYLCYQLMKNVEGAYMYFLQNNYLFRMLDLMMGKESTYMKYHPVAQDLPINIIPIIYESINFLLPFKQTIKGYKCFQQSFMPTTVLQNSILTNPTFYRRIIRLKYDNPSLSNIIVHYSFNDCQFSAIIAEFIISNINNKDSIGDLANFFHHIRDFLLIDDNLKQKRYAWILGIPQFSWSQKKQFCLEYSDRTDYMKYVSGINYKKIFFDNQRKPLLEIASERSHRGFDPASIYCINIILDLAIESQIAYQYLLAIPPQNYMLRSYFDWIPSYIQAAYKDNDLIFEKRGDIFTEINNKLEIISQKIKLAEGLPAQKYIIGKTVTHQIVEKEETANYELVLQKYTTYVLDNKPLGDENQSMPKKYFSMHQPKGFAHAFIRHRSKNNFQPEATNVKIAPMIYTLEGMAKKKLALFFKEAPFKHTIILNEGEFYLNFPYTKNGKIQDFVEIHYFPEYKFEPTVEDISKVFQIVEEKMKGMMMQQEKIDGYSPALPDAFIEPKIKCPTCTYDNDLSSERCEMCDNLLFS